MDPAFQSCKQIGARDQDQKKIRGRPKSSSPTLGGKIHFTVDVLFLIFGDIFLTRSVVFRGRVPSHWLWPPTSLVGRRWAPEGSSSNPQGKAVARNCAGLKGLEKPMLSLARPAHASSTCGLLRGHAKPSLVWPNLARPASTVSDQARPGEAWPGAARPRVTRQGLALPGQASIRRVWPGPRQARPGTHPLRLTRLGQARRSQPTSDQATPGRPLQARVRRVWPGTARPAASPQPRSRHTCKF